MSPTIRHRLQFPSLIFLVLACSAVHAQDCTAPDCADESLTSQSSLNFTPNNTGVQLRYNLCGPSNCPSGGGDGLQAADPAFLLGNAVATLDAYAALQFAPPFTPLVDVNGNPVVDMAAFDRNAIDPDGNAAPASASPNCVSLKASSFRNAQDTYVGRFKTRSVLAHELFHKVQFGQISGMPFSDALATNDFCAPLSPNLFGAWVGEAQATLMGSRWDLDVAASDATDYFAFMKSYVAGVLGTRLTDAPLTDASYGAGLFWSYCSDQMGVFSQAPFHGTDFVKLFWETARLRNDNNPQLNWEQATDSMALLDDVVESRGRGSVADIFHDFAIALYTHELDRDSILTNFADGSRYFFDEADAYIAAPGFFDHRYGLPMVNRFCYCLSSTGCTTEIEESLGGVNPDGTVDLSVSLAEQPCQPITFPALITGNASVCANYDGGDFNAYDQCERNRVRNLSMDYHQFDVTTVMQDPCGTLDLQARACNDVGWALVGIGPELAASSGEPPRREALFLRKGRGKIFSETIVPVPSLERLVLIVIGLDAEESLYDIRLDRSQPKLVIEAPTAAAPAYAGPSNFPERFLIRTRLVGVNEGVMPSSVCQPNESLELRPASFGPADVQAELVSNGQVVGELTVLAVDRVGEQYWLTVLPPSGVGNSVFDLRLRVGRGCDATIETSPSSVVYGDEIMNHMIVFDRSGSMNSPLGNPKLAAAQSAAQLYVSAVGGKDRVGLVGFQGGSASNVDCEINADVLMPIDAANPTHRDLTNQMIGELTAAGRTPLGDGIWLAQSKLEEFTSPADYHTMLILSDGIENEERFLFGPVPCESGQMLEPSFPRLQDSAIVANTVAFGPETNQEVLQFVADGARGIYQYVDVPQGEGGGAGLEDETLSMANSLALSFMESLAHSKSLELITHQWETLAVREIDVRLDLGKPEAPLTSGLVFFHWDEARTVTIIDLFDPSGKLLGPDRATRFRGPTHMVFHLNDAQLEPGVWTARIVTDNPTQVLSGVLAKDSLGVETKLRAHQPRPISLKDAAPEGAFIQGIPVTLRCQLTDRRGPILAAEIEVTVERPDGSLSTGRGCERLLLRDDGTQDDGAPNDGIYGLRYTQTQLGSDGGADGDTKKPRAALSGERGSYIVRGIARGETNDRDRFERPVSVHFQIFSGAKDTDGDGLPTGWEVYYGTDPSTPDANGELDDDLLRNIDEFNLGTDPRNPDSDSSGELDGSEARNGRCPTIPGDDSLPAPRDVEVVTDVGCSPAVELPENGVLLRFPWNGAYQGMTIERAESREGPWQVIARLDRNEHFEPFYVDDRASGGTVYFYRFQAVGLDRAVSRLSPIVHGRAYGDPAPPIGEVQINNGWTLSDSLAVLVQVAGATNATAYRVSDRPLKGDEPVQRLVNGSFLFTFPKPPRFPADGVLFVKLINRSGVESEQYVAAITIDPLGDADRDGERNMDDLDDDNDGIRDNREIDTVGTDPFNADTDGDGVNDRDDREPLFFDAPPPPAEVQFRRGDANADGEVNVADASRILGFLFLGDERPSCLKAADPDDTGTVELTGAVYLLEFLFLGGRPLPAPGIDCGLDRTPDKLTCKEYMPCRR